MTPQLNLLLAQTTDSVKEIVKEGTQGNSVPDSAITYSGTDWLGWFPESASTASSNVDWLYMFIFWVSAIFFAAIVGVMTYFVIKYRRKDGKIEPQPSTSHNTTIEILWSVLPSIILLYIFWVGAKGYFDMRIEREDVEEIQVRAFRWNWEFTYPDGDISSELHVVRDQPVKLIMRSDDVLHSMYIPAFRQKMDVVPGRYTYFSFVPTREGQYRLACTEYCGDEHSKMRTMCQVHIDEKSRKAATEWKEQLYKPWKNGERLFKINCAGCHKIDGTAATGPALNAIWKIEEKLMGGTTRLVDENYIRESILQPDKDIVEGYGPVSKMNSFQGKLKDNQIDQLIAYIKHLKEGDPTDKGLTEVSEETPAESTPDNSVDANANGDDNQN